MSSNYIYKSEIYSLHKKQDKDVGTYISSVSLSYILTKLGGGGYRLSLGIESYNKSHFSTIIFSLKKKKLKALYGFAKLCHQL